MSNVEFEEKDYTQTRATFTEVKKIGYIYRLVYSLHLANNQKEANTLLLGIVVLSVITMIGVMSLLNPSVNKAKQEEIKQKADLIMKTLQPQQSQR